MLVNEVEIVCTREEKKNELTWAKRINKLWEFLFVSYQLDACVFICHTWCVYERAGAFS